MAQADYSVVIPAYNRADTIGRAIASVLAQSLPPAEIVVVDDGSRDDLVAALAAFAGAPLRLVTHPVNRGAAAARNTGVAAAQSTWIAFLDSDDEWLADKMSLQTAALANAGAGVHGAVCGYRIVDRRNARIDAFHPRPCDVTLDALLLGCRISPGSTLVVARETYLVLGGLDESLPRLEDWDWAIRYLQRHTLVAVAEPLVVVHKGSDPSRAQVAAAVARLRAAWRQPIYARSWRQGRMFDSTLLVEEAAGALYDGDRAAAARLTLAALVAYPFREPAFYAMLARRGLMPLLRRLAGRTTAT